MGKTVCAKTGNNIRGTNSGTDVTVWRDRLRNVFFSLQTRHGPVKDIGITLVIQEFIFLGDIPKGYKSIVRYKQLFRLTLDLKSAHLSIVQYV